jgi:hypothetical protein
MLRYDPLSVHQVYCNAQDDRVPSVTQVLGDMIAKPGLVEWANRLGYQGVNSAAVTRRAALVGTAVHLRIEGWFKNERVDLSAISSDIRKQSFFGFRRFKKWWIGADLSWCASEIRMVNNRYGGTCDIAATDSTGNRVLIDIKTSTSLHPEYDLQLCAYAELYGRQKDTQWPAELLIVRVGRERNDSVQVRRVDRTIERTDTFEKLVSAWHLLHNLHMV